MSRASALEPEKIGFPSLSPRSIIVIRHQKCCKWRWLKVCDANRWSCECPKHQPWNLKKLGSLRSAQGTKNRKFDIPHHCDKSRKMLRVALAKNV